MSTTPKPFIRETPRTLNEALTYLAAHGDVGDCFLFESNLHPKDQWVQVTRSQVNAKRHGKDIAFPGLSLISTGPNYFTWGYDANRLETVAASIRRYCYNQLSWELESDLVGIYQRIGGSE